MQRDEFHINLKNLILELIEEGHDLKTIGKIILGKNSIQYISKFVETPYKELSVQLIDYIAKVNHSELYFVFINKDDPELEKVAGNVMQLNLKFFESLQEGLEKFIKLKESGEKFTVKNKRNRKVEEIAKEIVESDEFDFFDGMVS